METLVAAAPAVRVGPSLARRDLLGIERELHLRWHKWDTQVGDTSVLLDQPLILAADEWSRLAATAERLAAEVLQLESDLLAKPASLRRAGIPAALSKCILASPTSRPAMRAMRFDFHPTASGWVASEVNSDVPGGWCEGSVLPALFLPFYPGLTCPPSPLDAWGAAVERVAPARIVALLSAPGFMEDEQVTRAFSAELARRHIGSHLLRTPEALDWTAGCTLAGRNVSAIVRFYQAEWICWRKAGRQLLETRAVAVINPTVAALSESKRFALAFDALTAFPAWRDIMPESRDPRDVANWDDWVLKRTYSNTGDSVQICAALEPRARQRLIDTARRKPLEWVAQRYFQTLGVETSRGVAYPCVGVFVVNGRAAGAYVRLATGSVTNASALEAPLLIDPHQSE